MFNNFTTSVTTQHLTLVSITNILGLVCMLHNIMSLCMSMPRLQNVQQVDHMFKHMTFAISMLNTIFLLHTMKW